MGRLNFTIVGTPVHILHTSDFNTTLGRFTHIPIAGTTVEPAPRTAKPRSSKKQARYARAPEVHGKVHDHQCFPQWEPSTRVFKHFAKVARIESVLHKQPQLRTHTSSNEICPLRP